MKQQQGNIVSTPKILIVEDNYSIGLIMQEMILQNKYLCNIVHNGLEAVQILTCKKYDLVFMDIQMPVMNGIEATKKIRANENINKTTPIIAFSAMEKDVIENDCLEAGMDEFVHKPANYKKISSILNKYLKIKSIKLRETNSQS